MARKKVRIFDELHEALRDAAAFEKGEPVDLRAVEIPDAPKNMKPAEIKRIRFSLNASQALFAKYLNVSTNTVESWEQGTRRPQSTALRLLSIARKSPTVLIGSRRRPGRGARKLPKAG